MSATANPSSNPHPPKTPTPSPPPPSSPAAPRRTNSLWSGTSASQTASSPPRRTGRPTWSSPSCCTSLG
uniref:Uncharacterized protein n=1 Tax=Arcella intermedia TaxID=1963864 RepID=A0A6B2LRL7_9EUKA